LALLLQLLGKGHCDASVIVQTGVDRDTVSVAESLTFRIRIRKQADQKAVLLIQESGFPGRFRILESKNPIVKTLENGTIEEITDYVISSYETGDLEIPPLQVLVSTNTGDTSRVATNPITVTVKSVVEGIDDIKDIKAPEENVDHDVDRSGYWFWAAAALICVAALYLVKRVIRRKKPIEFSSVPIDWLEELKKISRMGLIEKGDYKRYYSLLSELARRYLEDRIGVEAMERTTFEVARDLHVTALTEDQVVLVERFLSEADLVKFAKFRPREEMAIEAYYKAENLIKDIDESIQHVSESGRQNQLDEVGK